MIPISERHAEYANKVADQLKAVGVRVDVDARNEKMNAKIREHAMQKVPFLLVVGDKEAEAGKVNVRTRGKEKTEDMPAALSQNPLRKSQRRIAGSGPHSPSKVGERTGADAMLPPCKKRAIPGTCLGRLTAPYPGTTPILTESWGFPTSPA